MRGRQACVWRSVDCQARSIERRRLAVRKAPLLLLNFQFSNVCHQFVFIGQASEVEADHLVRP